MSGRPSQAAQLKWHNTLPEDFTSRRAASNPVQPPHSVSVRKRLPTSAETMIPSDALMDDGRHSAEIMNDTIVLASPSKRYRATSRMFHTKTPTKSMRTETDSGTYSGSGMQTPPPSSTGAMKKRGRLSQRAPSVSHAARVASPPQTSPPKLRTVSTSALNSEYLTHAGKPALADGRAKAIFWNDGLDLGRGSAGHNQFDWNSLRGNLFPEEISEILSSEASLNTEQSSSEHTDSASDCVHFSFTHDTDFAPIAVDPNLIFSEPSSTASSMADGYSNARNNLTPSQRPYQHQRLQRQREHEERVQRRLRTQHGDELNRTTQRLSRSRSRTSIGSHSSRSSHPLTLRRTAGHPNINSGPFGQGHDTVPVHSDLGTVRRPSSSRSSESRAEVMLEISADGRAQTKASMVYMSDLVGEGDTGYWDSLDESDSSLDGDAPRGLAPDGSEYSVYRRRSAFGSVDTKSSVCETASKKNLQPQRLQFTPQKTSSSFAQLTTAAATRRRKIESSPRLPTPLRSSPPASTHRLGAMCSAEEPTPQLPQLGDADDSGSEAETVMDEEEPLEGDDTDALAALKKVLARSRGGKCLVRFSKSFVLIPCRYIYQRNSYEVPTR
jgi:hypothetical protein